MTFPGAGVALVFVVYLVARFTLRAMILVCVLASLAKFLDPGECFVKGGIAAGVFCPTLQVSVCRVMGNDTRAPPTRIASGLLAGIAAPILMASVMSAPGPTGLFRRVAARVAALTGAGVMVCHRLPAVE